MSNMCILSWFLVELGIYLAMCETKWKQIAASYKPRFRRTGVFSYIQKHGAAVYPSTSHVNHTNKHGWSYTLVAPLDVCLLHYAPVY